MLFPGDFSNSSSFLTIELWTDYWDIKTLLPDMSTSPLALNERQRSIHRRRLSQHYYGVYPTYMDSGAYRGFDEYVYVFWESVEAGAH